MIAKPVFCITRLPIWLARFRVGLLTIALCVFLMAAATAEPLVIELAAARADSDQRTGRPIVTITLATKDREAFSRYAADSVARTMELRVDGAVVSRSVIREPLIGGSFQLSGVTAEKAHAIAEQLSKEGVRVEVEILPD